MHTTAKINLQVILMGVILAMALVPVIISAQDPPTVSPPDPNPTGRWISPRHGQSADQQLSDEWECYDRACEEIDWDPYEAYTDLANQGYAVALTPEDFEEGLICLAREGAVTGAVAGDILGDARTGAEIGAAIAVASGVVRSDYLCRPDDPEARRTVSRFERELRNWDRKFAACLRPKGYRVPSS